MWRRLLPLVLSAVFALAGCRGRPDHPVLTTLRSPPPPGVVAAERAPEPGPPPEGMLARSMLFLGWQDVETPLRYLASRTTPLTAEPRMVQLRRIERAVLRRYRRGGPVGGLIRNVIAVGFSAQLPIPPQVLADLLLDPDFEREALDADRFETIGFEFDVAGASRRRARVELLRRGQSPFRFDLRFTSLTERWDLPDGSVIMRHDPYPDPPPEHVTLYRGATWIVPVGTGSRLTEFVVMGTDITVPFFLRGFLRGQSVNVFRIRAIRIWRRAHELARQRPHDAGRPPRHR